MKRIAAALMALCLSATAMAETTLDDVAARLKKGEYKGVTGALVSVGGKLVLDVPDAAALAGSRQDIRSATKSITAILVGELIEDGSLKSVKTPVSKLLPDLYKGMDKADPRREITVEDLLTMRSGLACNDWVPASLGNEERMYGTSDWSAFVVGLPRAYERGEHFSYCTGGVVLLGRVIDALSGSDVPTFADERLFHPLGIRNAKWEGTPEGHTDTGGHLRLEIGALLKIGQLVHAGGVWEGKQLIAADWIKAMTGFQTRIFDRRETYGYLWWRNEGRVKDKPVSITYAHGNGGNFIIIVPEIDLVAAFTGRNYNKPEQFTPMRMLGEEIIPALLNE